MCADEVACRLGRFREFDCAPMMADRQRVRQFWCALMMACRLVEFESLMFDYAPMMADGQRVRHFWCAHDGVQACRVREFDVRR